MEDIQTKTDDNESKLKTAEAYETHGLYDEALGLYKTVLESAELDDDTRAWIKHKVKELGKEIEEKDLAIPYDFSSDKATPVNLGLSDGESAEEVCDSAMAFKELGLYREASSEYQKLFQTDLSLDEYLPNFLECMLSLHAPSQVVLEVDKIIKENKLDDKMTAAIKFLLGKELSDRNCREMAIKCYQAVQKIDPI